MNDELKRKYELLKQRNKKKLMSLEFESDVLFQECKNVLNKCTILSLNESKRYFLSLKISIQFYLQEV